MPIGANDPDDMMPMGNFDYGTVVVRTLDIP
jgi:hypothetical protein